MGMEGDGKGTGRGGDGKGDGGGDGVGGEMGRGLGIKMGRGGGLGQVGIRRGGVEWERERWRRWEGGEWTGEFRQIMLDILAIILFSDSYQNPYYANTLYPLF